MACEQNKENQWGLRSCRALMGYKIRRKPIILFDLPKSASFQSLDSQGLPIASQLVDEVH